MGANADPPESDTKKKFGLIEYITSALIIAVITGTVAMMVNTYKSIQDDLSELKNISSRMSATTETMFRFCRASVKDPSNPTEFQQWIILDYIKENSSLISSFNNTRKSLGMLISPESNKQAHRLSCLVDQADFLSVKACLLNVPESKIIKVRNQTFNMIKEEIEQHQKPLQIAKDLFLAYTDDPRSKWPEKLPCAMPIDLLNTTSFPQELTNIKKLDTNSIIDYLVLQ